MDVVSEPVDPIIAGKNYPVNFENLACSSKSTNKISVVREMVDRQYVLDLVRCNF